MFENLSTDEVMDLARKASVRVAREYPGLEADDIMSAALEALSGKVDKLNNDSEPYIYKVLYNDAVRYAAKERYDYMVGTSTYVYRPKEVRALLEEAFWDPTMWDVPSAKDDWITATISGETIGISLIDIQEAWKGLKISFSDLLTRKFRDGEDVADRKAVTRAIDDLTRRMNRRTNRYPGNHDGPGAREALSNSASQFVTRAESGFEAENYRPDSVHELHVLKSRELSPPAGTFYDWDRAVA